MPSAPRGDSADRVGRVTIVDVARRAGVSKSTVSLVLSGSELVAEATKLRVNEAMGALGYVYHRGAASLRAASSDLVGMVMGDLSNPFFAELTAGIEDALFQRGFTPILANTSEDTTRQAQVLRAMREHNVAGIIMSPARGTDTWTLAQQWPSHIPAIITIRRMIGSSLPYIGPDNQKGERDAVEHLLKLGHRRIAFIGGDANMSTQRERVSGWRDALNGWGLAADESLIFEVPPTRDGGRCGDRSGARQPTPANRIRLLQRHRRDGRNAGPRFARNCSRSRYCGRRIRRHCRRRAQRAAADDRECRYKGNGHALRRRLARADPARGSRQLCRSRAMPV